MASGEAVVSGAAEELVVDELAVEAVVALVAVDEVATATAEDAVVARSGVHVVAARAAEPMPSPPTPPMTASGPGPAAMLSLPEPPRSTVGARVADEAIDVAAAAQPVVADLPDQQVLPAPPASLSLASGADETVGSLPAGRRVLRGAREDPVRAAAARDPVGVAPAADHVAARLRLRAGPARVAVRSSRPRRPAAIRLSGAAAGVDAVGAARWPSIRSLPRPVQIRSPRPDPITRSPPLSVATTLRPLCRPAGSRRGARCRRRSPCGPAHSARSSRVPSWAEGPAPPPGRADDARRRKQHACGGNRRSHLPCRAHGGQCMDLAAARRSPLREAAYQNHGLDGAGLQRGAALRAGRCWRSPRRSRGSSTARCSRCRSSASTLGAALAGAGAIDADRQRRLGRAADRAGADRDPVLRRPVRPARAAGRALERAGPRARAGDAAHARPAGALREGPVRRPELGRGLPARRGALADRPGRHLDRRDLAARAGVDPPHAQPGVRSERRARAAVRPLLHRPRLPGRRRRQGGDRPARRGRGRSGDRRRARPARGPADPPPAGGRDGAPLRGDLRARGRPASRSASPRSRSATASSPRSSAGSRSRSPTTTSPTTSSTSPRTSARSCRCSRSSSSGR